METMWNHRATVDEVPQCKQIEIKSYTQYNAVRQQSKACASKQNQLGKVTNSESNAELFAKS